jgi:peroxiredoxin
MRRRPPGPEVGSEAPAFDLAVLNGGGQRVRLEDLRGKPVGLIFGSYT